MDLSKSNMYTYHRCLSDSDAVVDHAIKSFATLHL